MRWIYNHLDVVWGAVAFLAIAWLIIVPTH